MFLYEKEVDYMTFNNGKCDYATIIFSSSTIEGPCSYWEVSGEMVKLIINGKQYITSISNVLLEEN